MRVVVITAVWRRHQIMRAFWAFCGHLREWWGEHEVLAAVAGSQDPEHEAMAREWGALYVDVPNNPLGRKFNAALQAARTLEPDIVLLMGSDDVFSREVAEAYRPHFTRDAYVGLRDLYFYQTETGAMGYWPGYPAGPRWGEPAGCGRLIGRRWLEAVTWHPWDDAQQNCLDYVSNRAFAAAGAPHFALLGLEQTGGCAVDCKSAVNLWGIERIVRSLLGHPSRDALLAKLPTDMLAILLPLRQRQAA